MKSITNIAGYKFIDVDQIPERAEKYKTLCSALDIKGFMLLAPEGVNINFAGTAENIEEFLETFRQDSLFSDFEVKYSISQERPFGKLRIRQRGHIIPFTRDVRPGAQKVPGISAQALKKEVEENENLLILDVRNDYETALGKFKNSQLLDIRYFRFLPEVLEKLPEEELERMKKKDVVTVCTGGIKTEKATLWMMQNGFESVRKLDGGILKYLEDVGEEHWEGTCFVFDKRVGVDTKLDELDAEQSPNDPFLDNLHDKIGKKQWIEEKLGEEALKHL